MAPEDYMSRALELAINADLARDTNPIVGAVIVDAAGKIVIHDVNMQPISARCNAIAVSN